MASAYRVTVYRNELRRMYQRGGEGYRWLDKVRLAMHAAAVREASEIRRTGVLAASHRSEIKGRNQYAADAVVWNTAEHALWVHEGTTGWIVPKDSEYLSVPAYPFAPPGVRVKKDRVDGQRANPWLDRACQSIALREGAFGAL